MTNPPTPVDELTYLQALDELESILERLEHDEPDVDRVAEDVGRASALILHCRTRIASARIQVEQVMSETDEDGEPTDDADATDA